MGIPAILIMTPEYRRWLKSSKRYDLDILAKKHGYIIKRAPIHSDDYSDNFVSIWLNGERITKGVRKPVDIFHFTEAIKLIKKATKEY